MVQSIEAYLQHAYNIKLLNRVNKCAERAFSIDPVAHDDCPEESNGGVSEVMNFATDMHVKREHDLTCRFPDTHKEVHHLMFAPKFVAVDEIEKDHPRSAKKLRPSAWDYYSLLLKQGKRQCCIQPTDHNKHHLHHQA